MDGKKGHEIDRSINYTVHVERRFKRNTNIWRKLRNNIRDLLFFVPQDLKKVFRR